MDLRMITNVVFWTLSACICLPQVQMKKCPGIDTCACREFKYSTSISCNPVPDMNPITELLRKFFINKTVSFLQLSSCSVRDWKDQVFSSIEITSIRTYCPLQTIDNSTFSSIKGLRKLFFIDPGFVQIPIALQKLPRLETLSFSRHGILSLNHELKNMGSLKTLAINKGNLSSISNDAFVDTKNLTFLYLSCNMLTSLHTTTFDPLFHLQEIDLSGNQLQVIDGLFSKLNPQVINLFDNNITDISGLLHDGMWKVQTLQLGRNRITDIASSTFNNKIPNVQWIDLSNNRLKIPAIDLFHNLTLLSKIYLNYNGIQELPQGIFKNLAHLEVIDLRYNFLPSTPEIFVDLPALDKLELTFNKFTSLSDILRNLTQLKMLFLAKNELMSLSKTDFDSIPNIEVLDLAFNRIQVLTSGVFSSLSSLESLNISYNNLESFNSSLQSLVALENLQAVHCRLRMIGKNDFVNLTRVKRIELSYNNITEVNGAFHNLTDLEELSINGNFLKTLSRDTFAQDLKIKKLNLRGNPWICDCRLLWLIEWLSESGFTVLDDNPYCESPPRLQGIALKQLTASNLTEWTDECPLGCSCECTPNGDGFYVAVDCSHVGLETIPDTLPKPLGELIMDYNNLTNISSSVHFLSATGLKIFHLNFNLIQDVNLSWPDSLEELMLSNNEITRFPIHSFNSSRLKKLTLGGNPWMCDCETVDFQKWLLINKEMVSDVYNVRCGSINTTASLVDMVIISLTDQQLCPESPPMRDLYFYMSIAGGVLGVILIICFILYVNHRCGFTTKAWLYSRGFTFLKKPDDPDSNKDFDILLSYASADKHLARNIIAETLKVENPSLTICDPQDTDRNTDPIAATRTCKRIVAILSPEYLEDRTSMTIFHIACSVSQEEGTDRLIVIKYGTLPSDKNLNPVIRKLLKKRKHLVWGENLFWEKFYFALPGETIHSTSAQSQQHDDELLCPT